MGAAWNTEDLVFYSSRPWLRGVAQPTPPEGCREENQWRLGPR